MQLLPVQGGGRPVDYVFHALVRFSRAESSAGALTVNAVYLGPAPACNPCCCDASMF